jgi:hypothetical protein
MHSTNTNPDANGYGYTDGNCHSYANGYCYGYTDGNCLSYANGYSDRNCYGYSNTHRDPHVSSRNYSVYQPDDRVG